MLRIVGCVALVGLARCGEAKQKCRVMFKAQVFFSVDGRDGWVYPRDVCEGIARAIAESSEGARTELFGMGAESVTTALPCVCE
jgi:hypothetical protein